MSYIMDEINDITGYANGEKFTSPQQVREYFTIENMRQMTGGAWGGWPEEIDQETLSAYAECVIESEDHCDFARVVHCCHECGEMIEGEICERHPNAMIDSLRVRER